MALIKKFNMASVKTSAGDNVSEGGSDNASESNHGNNGRKVTVATSGDVIVHRSDGDQLQPNNHNHSTAVSSSSSSSSIDTSSIMDNSIATHPPTDQSQYIADMARATQNSMSGVVGAFRIESQGGGASASDGGSNNISGSSSNNPLAATPPNFYSNENLPPNIDIIAEATLVVKDNDDLEEATCECRSSTDNPSDPSSSAQHGNGNGTTETAAADAEPFHAQKLDNMSVYACGRYTRFQRWHFVAASIVVIVCIVAPIASVTSNKNYNENKHYLQQEQKNNWTWTKELIEGIVSPSVSSPESFLQIPSSAQNRAVDWLANRGADIITGPSIEAVEWRVRQRYILAVLYYSTSGEQWKNQYEYLDESKHECDWGGMLNNGWKSTDCNSDKEITLINLWQNDLRGTIPREIASLNLHTIDLLMNNLEGTIPEEIYTKKLNYLNLGYNKFTGTVSSALGNLDQLTYLMIDNNQLTGTIPSELGKLTQLSGWLSLEGNMLNGTVPESFAQLTNASWIYLNRNYLEGSVEFLCEALRPVEAPGSSINTNSSSALLELYVDINEVECSCCNCCPFVE